MSLVAPIAEKHDGKLSERANTRVWLRMLSCTMTIEKELKRRFAERGTTLPRFDVMAALQRHPAGMTMSALSAALLVSNGNLTGLAKRLAADGLVEASVLPSDLRSSVLKLTAEGRRQFSALAREHNDWIDELLGELQSDDREGLFHTLGTIKLSIARATQVRKTPA